MFGDNNKSKKSFGHHKSAGQAKNSDNSGALAIENLESESQNNKAADRSPFYSRAQSLLRNQSGFSFVAAIIAVTGAVLTLLYTTSQHYVATTRESARMARMIRGQDALQNLGVRLQEAYLQRQILGAGCGSGGLVEVDNAFCFSNPTCIDDPKDPAVGVASNTICFDPNNPRQTDNQVGFFTAYIEPKSQFGRLKKFLNAQILQVGRWSTQLLDHAQVIASAQQAGQQAWLPALTGAPINSMARPASCNGGAFPLCRMCEGNPNSDLVCLNFRVCLIDLGCASDDQYVYQRVGVVVGN